tara:strand:- start:1368 stop:2462 length:1095 start_codon:yes stop_codon:yes gene_type:complete
MNIFLQSELDYNPFCNGLLQNTVTFANLLEQLGHNVFFVVRHPKKDVLVSNLKFPVLSLNELYFNNLSIDILINIAWSLDEEYLKKLKKRKGNIRVVSLHYGNRMNVDMKRVVNEDNKGQAPMRNHESEVWTSPQFKGSIEYYKTYYNTDKVFIAPYIWSSSFVDQAEKEVNQKGKSCFYKPKSRPIVGIFEPNFDVYKNCTIPLAICKNSIKNIKHIDLFNTKKLVTKKNSYLRSLIFKTFKFNAKQISFYDRLHICLALSSGVSLIVSHQDHVELNYLYLEALHFGTPLIHNSSMIKDFGYYYPNFDCLKGSKELNKAILTHDDNLEEYKEKAKNCIDLYSIDNINVIKEYNSLVNEHRNIN